MNAKKPQRELYNESAERDVLVAASLSREALFKVLDMEPEDFYFQRYRDIYKAMSEMNEMDIPVTLPTLFAKLRETGGYYDKFIDEFSTTVLAHTVPYLIQNIQTHRKKRELLAATKDLFQAITEGAIDIEDAGERMLRLLGEMNAPREIEYRTTRDLATTSLDSLFTSGGFIEAKLNSVKRTLKFFNGQLVTLAARPGCGKSSLALQMADDLSMDGERVLYFSLEMKVPALFSRLLSRHSLIEANRIKAAAVKSEELERLIRAQDIYRNNGNIIIYDNVFQIVRLANAIRRECERDLPRAIFIDYLQLISGGEGNNQAERIGYITRTLKLLAMLYDIPIFILSQLNRKIEETGREPNMSDLRDSGRIEEDSDVVIFLHPDKEDRQRVKFIVSKNRDGGIGYVELFYNARFTVFQDYEQHITEIPRVDAMSYMHD